MAINGIREQEFCSLAEAPPEGGTDQGFPQRSLRIEFTPKNSRGHAIGWLTLPHTTLKIPFLGHPWQPWFIEGPHIALFPLLVFCRRASTRSQRKGVAETIHCRARSWA